MLLQGVPRAAGIALGRQFDRYTALPPIRMMLGPISLNSAMRGALLPVKNASVTCVFSKLRPANAGTRRPIVVPGVTVTVPGIVGPDAVGPPSTGAPHMKP